MNFANWKYNLLCLALTLSGCTDDLQAALEFAGENRAELEEVLAHYRECGDAQQGYPGRDRLHAAMA